jgi:Zn-dependent protease with chaperone function
MRIFLRRRMRRSLCAVLIAVLLDITLPLRPAQAVTTAHEIQAGQAEDKQITQQYTVLNDPLLNQWINGIGEKLWNQTARKDIPYNIKVIDTNDVNAFSTLGGYIYVNVGTLDFVQSDDELAGVIGHETGHIERRHAVTFPVKAQALDLLFGIASLFAPLVYGFGQIAEAGMLAKTSRTQETQADQYGLLLMSRAGYDPDAMVSFMDHLGAAHAENDDSVDKYLADHPDFPNRVARLLGYDELDPKKRTNDQILVQALHDQQSARYNIATMKFQRFLKSNSSDGPVLLHLGETQIALGLPNKAEQTLLQSAANSVSGTHTQALTQAESLSKSLADFIPQRIYAADLLGKVHDAHAHQTDIATTLTQRRDPEKDQLKAVTARIQNISYNIPNLSKISTRPNTRGGTIMRNLTGMSRSLNTALETSKQSIDGIGSLESNKKSGLIKENADILEEMLSPLKLSVIPEPSLSVLPSYPHMLADLDRADGDMIRALDTSRSALTLLDAGLRDLDDLLRRLRQIRSDFNGDIQQNDYNTLLPLMSKASASLNKAAVSGSQAWQWYNLARSRQLQTRITMLGLTFPEERYSSLRYALRQRVKNDGLPYDMMLHDNLTPGEVASASIIAADTNAAPQDITREAQTTHQSIVDVANAHNMSAYALKIFLGLIYLDYTDDPTKEAHDTPNAPPILDLPALTERS